MTKRKLTDAREPNAGTDFHILWSVKKCLELLNFNSDGLKSITIEGIDPVDSSNIDPDGDSLLGVDYTEYYSNSNFKQASHVVICQLKYSTRHAGREWTAYSISQGKKRSAGSILERLATTFNKLSEAHGVDAVLKKTNVKLISNRPASPLLDITHHSLPIISEHSLPAFQSIVYQLEAGLNKLFQSKVYHSLVGYS